MKLKPFFFLAMLILCVVLVWKTFIPKALPDFETVLFQIDTTAISSVVWTKNANELILVREGKRWLIAQNSRTVQALPTTVEQFLLPLQRVETYDWITQKQTAWEEFGVTEEQAIRVQLYKQEQLLEDFWLSHLVERDSLNRLVTYVRLAGEQTVFQVSGELSQAFQIPFSNFRNSAVLLLDTTAEIVAVDYFLTPDSSLHFAKAEAWHNIAYAAQFDSTAIKNYLAQLESLHHTSFADNFDETKADDFFYRAIHLTLSKQTDPIRLECFQDSSLQTHFILHSSQNNDTYFASDSSELYNSLFAFFEK